MAMTPKTAPPPHRAATQIRRVFISAPAGGVGGGGSGIYLSGSMVAPMVIEPEGFALMVSAPGRSAQPATARHATTRKNSENFMGNAYLISAAMARDYPPRLCQRLSRMKASHKPATRSQKWTSLIRRLIRGRDPDSSNPGRASVPGTPCECTGSGHRGRPE